MRLTARDLKLFRHLSDYGMLTTKQINKIIFYNVATTTVLRRLRILEKEKFIKRLMGLNSGVPLWIITEEATKVFEGGEYFKKYWNKNLLEHDFKLLCLRLLLEERGIAKSWEPEHKIRYLVFQKYGHHEAKDKLIPDGLMITETSSKKVSVAIELELTLKNKERIRNVLRRYLEKKDLDTVWYICGHKGVGNAVMNTWNSLKGSTSMRLKVSLFHDVMSGPSAQLPAQGVRGSAVVKATAPLGLTSEFHNRNTVVKPPTI